jgi:hypothetical protein
MFLSIGVILFVAFVAYIWTSQGLFSALLHFMCTLIAGAIAFAVWEPLVYGAFMGMREDLSWTLGLAVPFLVSLGLLRVLTDKFIPGNLEVSNAANAVGGGVFGFLSAVITAGIFVISIGFLRVPANFMGYTPVAYDLGTGNVVKGSNLWLPADMITTKIYEQLSTGSFSAGRSALATRNPDIYLQAGMVRMTNQGNRVTLKPGDLKVIGSYEVNGNRDALLTDSFTFDNQTGESIEQAVNGFDGQPISGPVKIWGVAIEFLSGAREDTGQIVLGPGQVRLVADSNGEIISANPIAVISRADGASVTAGRWRFDAPEVYVASVGAGASAAMTFEFLVPADAQPVDLMIKNVRIPPSRISAIAGQPQGGFTVETRDRAIRTLELLGMEPVDPGQATAPISRPVQTGDSAGAAFIDGTSGDQLREAGIFVGPQLVTGPLVKSKVSGLKLDDQNQIISGEASVSKADLGDARGGAAALQIDRFLTTPDTVIVQVDVSLQKRVSPFGRALSAAERVAPLILHDTIGQVYEPIGYVYDNGRDIQIRYDPQRPLRALSEIPTLSRTAQNDELVIVFLVSRGVSVSRMTLGNTVLAEFNPAVPTERQR